MGEYRHIDVQDYVDKMDKEKFDNFSNGIENLQEKDIEIEQSIGTLNDDIASHASDIQSLSSDISDLSEIDDALDGRLTTVEQIIGGGSSATMTASNTTGWITTTVSNTMDVNITFTWSSIESEIPTGDGSISITVNNTLKYNGAVEQGNLSFNIKNYLSNGRNNVTVKITDVYGTFKTFKMTINVVSLTITSSYDFNVVRFTDALFNCTIKGSVEKTIHLKIDDTEVYSDTTTVATKTYSIPIEQQTHGTHTIECYVTATINGTSITSNIIKGETIWYSTSGETVLKVEEIDSTTKNQYDNYSFKYQVYNSASLENQVTIEENGVVVLDTNVDRTVHTFNVRLKISGTVTYVITSGEESYTITLTVTQKELPVSIETQGIEMCLKAEGKSQLDNPNQWTDSYGTTTTFTKTPIWDNNLETGTRLLLNNNTAIINKKILQNDPKLNGKTIEFDFEVQDMTDLDEVVISCYNDNRGIKISNHDFVLKSSAMEAKQYFDNGERIHVTYVIESNNTNHFVFLYINGVISQIKRYESTDIFNQTTPVNITLTANGCKLYVYNIISYNVALDRQQVLDNYIACHENIDELLEIYNRCDVMTNGEIDRTKLKEGCEYVILETPNEGQQLPQTKADPQIINFYYVNHDDPSRNWSAEGCKCKVQGTSSAVYIRKNYTVDCSNSGCVIKDANGNNIDGWALDPNKTLLEKVFVMKKNLASLT